MMQVVGNTVNKIEATRSDEYEQGMKIQTHINITDVKKKEFSGAGENKEGAVVTYTFDSQYGEKFGKISIEGAMFLFGTEEELKKLIADWEKNKKLDEEANLPLINKATELAYLVAIPVAKELKLPTPLRLPRFVKKE